MLAIEDKATFQSVLRSEQALIFVAFAWSGQSLLSERVVRDYAADPERAPDVPVYRLDGDSPFAVPWLQNTVRESTGYGSVVWLRRGDMVAYTGNAASAGVRGLAEEARRLFAPD